MKTKRTILASVALLLVFGTSVAQHSEKDVAGSWMGKIQEAGTGLRVIFNFIVTDADTIRATLDSPDQSAEGVPLGRVRLEGDSILVNAPIVRGSYRGTITNDTLIKGIWNQLGKDYPLDIVRQKAPLQYRRPQEPIEPYPYKVEEVIFHNSTENFDLAGTLTIPQGNGPFPAIILISGSGPEDRDETVFRHKPFWVLADHLTRSGFMVLRYDDRGVGKSKGSMSKATTLTLADDAEAALTYLLSRPETDSRRLGLAGHSEGGIIAAIVGSRNNNVDFIVSLAGPGVKGYDLIMRQTRDLLTLSGQSEKEVVDYMYSFGKACEMIMAEGDQRKVAKDGLEWYSKELDKKEITPEERKSSMSTFTQVLVSLNNPWMRYFLNTDPTEFWTKVKCPVLAMNGEKDVQVSYEMNLPGIKEALKQGGNKKVTTVSLPMHNHLFQHCTTGLPAEYMSIEETFSPEAMETITSWIRKTLKIK